MLVQTPEDDGCGVQAWRDTFGPDAEDTCAYCGRPATTLDHLRPVLRNRMPTGYGHSTWNLVPACFACNSAKRNTSWHVWMGRLPPHAGLAAWIERFMRLERFADLAPPPARTEEQLEMARAMHSALRDNVYGYCALLHDVVVKCRDDPEHWREHVDTLPQNMLGAGQWAVV